MKTRILIKNIVIITVILTVVFLSQQPFSKINSKNYVYSQGANGTNSVLKNAGDWFKNNVTSRISGGISGGAAKTNATISATKNTIDSQKNNFLKNSLDSTKKFMAKETLQILGVTPQDLGCPAK